MFQRYFSLPFARHEVRVWLANPATVLFVGFAWALVAVLGFEVGGFFSTNRASMEVFLGYMPWVYALVLPALCMGLWAEDWRRGTAERLLTLPLSITQLVLTRFVVAWGLVGVFLVGTWPLLAAVAWLGNPDWGMVAAGYVGVFLLGGVLLGFALVASALANHAVVAFAGGGVLLVFVLLSGWGWVLDGLERWLPGFVVAGLREVSVLEHLRRFVQGQVDMRSVTYLLGLMLLALALQTAVLMHRTGRGKPLPWVLGGLLAALVVAGAGSVVPLRWDWTYENQFTLSPASRSLIQTLPKPLTFTVYDSRTNPDMPTASRITARRLNDVLREVKALNPSMVNVLRINPDVRVDDEVEAQDAGLTEQELPNGQGFYLGLVAEMNGRKALIPVLEPSRLPYVEFDLMSLVAEVQKLGQKNIAVLAVPNLRMRDLRPTWLNELEGYYNVTTLLPGNPVIPPDTDVLVVMMAPYLPQESLYAIDQYVVNGGRVMLLMDPYFRTAPTDDLKTPDRNADAFALDHPADLLNGWGLTYDGMSIVADTARASTVNEPKVGFRTYPLWLNLTPQDINSNLPFTSYVETLQLAEAGHVEVGTLAPGLTATPVLSTSANAQLVSRTLVDSTDPQLYGSAAQGTPQRYTLSVLLAGNFPSLFASVPPAVANYYADYAPVGQPAAIPPHSVRGTSEGAILVIADNDLLDPAFTVRPSGRVEGELEPTNDNLVFFFNALQYLAGEGQLLSLRGKAAVPRTFTAVEAMLARLSNRYAGIENRMAADLYRVGQKLDELKTKQAGDGTQTLSTVAQTELRAYKARNLHLRNQLRDVRKALRRDVLMVERVLLVFTALCMPFLAGLGWWLVRRRKRV
ncbi:MAG: Gldg family protein [Alphaproteobacteria bacterium]